MIYEYHWIRLPIALTHPVYYLQQLTLLGATDILYEVMDIFTMFYVKTPNLRFKHHFRQDHQFYRSLQYIQRIQKYNFKLIKRRLF